MREVTRLSSSIKIKAHTIIISDLHLGSSVSRSQKVIDFLQSAQFRKLILLGDVFESLNFEKLKAADWQLLFLISEFSKEKKVRWVEGNHDKGLIKIFSAFTGAQAYKVYHWQYKKKKYLAIHGHQFDYFLINNYFLSYLANLIYNFIQLIDFKDKRISRFIKRKSKGWLKLSQKVAKRALWYAYLRKVDFIFCGHTHRADKKRKRGIWYYNSGCWTDIPATFITIDENKIKIGKYY